MIRFVVGCIIIVAIAASLDVALFWWLTSRYVLPPPVPAPATIMYREDL